MELNVKKLHPDTILPVKAHDTDLGYDLFSIEDIVVKAGSVTKVNTGISCGFPKGYGGLIRDRSSVATKQKIFTVAGVLDEAYTGPIIVAFQNPFDQDVLIQKGQKIAQMILTPVVTAQVVEVDELGQTERNDRGFGSTGV